MNSTMRSVVASIGVCVGVTLAQTPASAGPGDVTKSGASFWEWAVSIPFTVNPLRDATGEHCMVGQSGDVWYLAGTFYPLGSDPVERECSVPAGTAFFVPAVNFVSINSPDVCGQQGSLSVAELRAQAAAAIDTSANVSVTVDGVPVGNLHRTKSGVFAVTLPDDNLFEPPCTAFGLGDVPGGVYSPAVDDGYYAQINALSPGLHTVHIYAEMPAGTVAFDVTYHLTVVATINH
jgi:hypothetical protein